MKLGKIWKYFDFSHDFVIWYADKPEDDFKKIEGEMLDGCPKILRNYELIKCKNNSDSEAIFAFNGETNQHGYTPMVIRFTVVKKQ